MTKAKRLYRLFIAEVCDRYAPKNTEASFNVCEDCPHCGNPTCRKEPKDYNLQDIRFMMDAVYGARDNK